MDERNYNRAQRRAIARYDAKNAKSINAGELKKSLSLKELYELAERASEDMFDAFPFAKKAASLFSWEEHSAAEYGSFSRALYKTYITGRPCRDAISACYYISCILLNIARCVSKNNTKKDIVSIESGRAMRHLDPIDALQLRVAEEYFMLGSESDRQHLLSLKEKIGSEHILGTAIERLDNYLADFCNAYFMGPEIEKYMKEELCLEVSDMPELRSTTNQLFSGLIQLQRYTIRQSIFDDETKLFASQAWAVIDPHYTRGVELLDGDEVHLLKKHHGGIAHFVSIHEGSDITEIAMSVDRQPRNIGVSYPFTANFDRIFMLCEDGELYYSTYPVALSWREIFKKAGHEAAYEFLRFQFIARLFDLVVPREISEQTPSMDGLAARIGRIRNEQPLIRPVQVLRDLITPRTRILRDREGIKKAQEREDEGVGKESENQKVQRQFLGRVGHPMSLRAGYRPHPKAKEWAKEDGFWRDLEPNETWCRPVESPVPVVHRQKRTGEKKKEGNV